MNHSPHASAKPPGLFAAFISQPYLLLTLAPLFWGGNFVIGKLAVGQVDPIVLVIGRWVGATLFAAVLAWPHLRRDWPQIKKHWWLFAIFGAVGFTTYNALIYGAAHFTTGTNISIGSGSIAIFVLLGNFLIFKVRVRPLQILGIFGTILGIVWITTHGEPARLLSLTVNIGDGMVLLSSLAYAIYSLILRYRPDVHWLSFIFLTAFFALLTAFFIQMIWGGGLGRLAETVPQTTLAGYLCILYTTIFPSLIAQLCYARGVELVGANRASIFISLLPVFGTLQSVLILGEWLEGYHIVSAILVFGGIFLSEYSVRRRK